MFLTKTGNKLGGGGLFVSVVGNFVYERFILCFLVLENKVAECMSVCRLKSLESNPNPDLIKELEGETI